MMTKLSRERLSIIGKMAIRALGLTIVLLVMAMIAHDRLYLNDPMYNGIRDQIGTSMEVSLRTLQARVVARRQNDGTSLADLHKNMTAPEVPVKWTSLWVVDARAGLIFVFADDDGRICWVSRSLS